MSRNEHDAGFEHVTAQWLASQLLGIQRGVAWDALLEPDELACDASIDVRLQVAGGDAYVHSGSADYDQDHRGYWGASSIARDDDWSRLLEIATDLISQALDMQADSQLPD